MSKNQEILAAWSEFFVAHALSVRQIENEIKGKAPLSLDEYDLLLVLSRSVGQRLRFSALADATIYTRSGITRIIKRMEKEGYILRQSCPEDRRGSYAFLTKAGQKALAETWRWYSQAVINIFSKCFNKNEAEQLASLLARVVDSLTQPSLVQISKIKKLN